MMLSIFSCACWPSEFPLWKNVYSGLLPIFKLDFLFFFFLMLSYVSYLFILDINPLSVISFANVFSCSEVCLSSYYRGILYFSLQFCQALFMYFGTPLLDAHYYIILMNWPFHHYKISLPLVYFLVLSPFYLCWCRYSTCLMVTVYMPYIFSFFCFQPICVCGFKISVVRSVKLNLFFFPIWSDSD